jgi:hypothetical protein
MRMPREARTAGLALLGLLLLLAALVPGWHKHQLLLFVHGDGHLYLSHYKHLHSLTSAGEVTAIEPYMGMGSIFLPTSTWLNPGLYLLQRLEDPFWRLAVCYAIILAEFYCSLIVLARAFHMPPILGVVASQLVCIGLFPPVLIGFPTAVYINPVVGHVLAVGNVALAVFLWQGTGSRWRNLTLALAFPLLVLYGIHCEALWPAVLSLTFGFFALIFLVLSRSRREVWWKVGTVALTVLLLVLLGVHDFYRGLASGVAREVFLHEITGNVQSWSDTGVLFSARIFPYNALKVIGQILLLLGAILDWRCARRQGWRPLGAGVVLFFLVMACLDFVFVYVWVNWTQPPPSYFLIAAYAPLALVAARGYGACFQQVWLWLRLRSRLTAPAGEGDSSGSCWGSARRRLLAVGGLALLPGAVGAIVFPLKYVSPIERALFGTLKRATRFLYGPGGSPLLDELLANIQLLPGKRFNGSVCSPVFNGPACQVSKVRTDVFEPAHLGVGMGFTCGIDNRLIFLNLWHSSIPTLEEYSQMVSPFYYYMVSRRMMRPEDWKSRNWIFILHPDFPLLQAMGCRYVLSDRHFDHPQLSRRQTRKSPYLPCELHLYELSNPNLGHYSPTQVVHCPDADSTLQAIASPQFDFTSKVVLHEPLEADLVPASGGQMTLQRNGLHVRARSDGTSLLLLPTQFSHCLVAREQDGSPSTARLLRANLCQTAVLFQGDLDIVLRLEYGPFTNARARLQDVEDIRRLKLKEDEKPLPQYLHPHAWIGKR